MRLLVAGPPCAGKTAFAEQFAAATGAQVVDYDSIAAEFGSTGWDHPEDIRRLVRSEYDRRVDTLDGPVVVIRSAPTSAERAHWAQRINADQVIVLDVPADVAKYRAGVDGRPEWTGDAIDRWWSNYQPTGPQLAERPERVTESPTEWSTMGTETEKVKEPQAETANPPAQGEVPRPETGKPAETAPENPPSTEKLPDDHPVVIALRKANQEAAAARAKIKEFEDKDKSELDKAIEAAAAAVKAQAETELENQRLKAAVKFGLSEDDLALLGDGPADGFMARAEALAARLAVSTPQPNPIVGQAADAAGSIDEQIAAAQKAGDVNRVIHLQNQKLARN